MPAGAGRTLKTAQAVLRVLRLLEQQPTGRTADEVATALGKSTATATYLLNSLCAEGFAERHGRTGTYRALSWHEPAAPAVADTGTQRLRLLHERTGERCYLATVEDTVLVVQATLGRRGQPLVPGLRGRVTAALHATALGKALLAHAPLPALDHYLAAHGLRAHTAATITDRPTLEVALALVRARGYAVEREELATGACAIAAPLRGTLDVPAALAVSLPPRRFRAHADRLADEVVEIAQAGSRHGSEPTTDVACTPPSRRWRPPGEPQETARDPSRAKEPT